ncbi:MAG TPA: hypothetical protein VGF59_01925 [Bryobacteraceae bacterium]|jgi:hypothetical protein
MESAFQDPADEIATLRQLLAERDAIIAEHETALATAAIEIEHLKVQLAVLRRAQYGRSPRSWQPRSSSWSCGWRILRRPRPSGQHRCGPKR